MVFDEWKNNYLVVDIIAFQSKQNNISKFMDVINWKMQKSKQDWKPNDFIVDDVMQKSIV
jgi:hypothetical protein